MLVIGRRQTLTAITTISVDASSARLTWRATTLATQAFHTLIYVYTHTHTHTHTGSCSSQGEPPSLPHTSSTHAFMSIPTYTDTRRCQLASCLIYAWPLRPDRWLVGARFTDSWRSFRVLVWVHYFIESDFLKTMYHSTIYHSNLSDQLALKIGLGLGLDSELHYFSIFYGE